MKPDFLRLVDRTFFAGMIAHAVALLLASAVALFFWSRWDAKKTQNLSDRIIEASRFELSESFFIIETLGTEQPESSPALSRATQMMKSQGHSGFFRTVACHKSAESSPSLTLYKFSVADRSLATCVFWESRALGWVRPLLLSSGLLILLLVLVGSSWWVVRRKVNQSVVVPLLTALETSARKEVLAEVASQVAHDIRSPIAALRAGIGSIDIGDAEGFEEIRVMLEKALGRLNDISEDLLSRRRELLSETPSEKVDIVDFARSILSEKQKEIGEGTQLVFTSTVGLRASMDRKVAIGLGRVLSNLVNNAREASRLGEPIRVMLESEDGKTVSLSVQDTGAGMPASLVEEIMAGEVRTTKADGNGLGLSGARKFAGSLGGQLIIRSRIGLGTSISVVFQT